jgi:hypothetical protein
MEDQVKIEYTFFTRGFELKDKITRPSSYCYFKEVKKTHPNYRFFVGDYPPGNPNKIDTILRYANYIQTQCKISNISIPIPRVSKSVGNVEITYPDGTTYSTSILVVRRLTVEKGYYSLNELLAKMKIPENNMEEDNVIHFKIQLINLIVSTWYNLYKIGISLFIINPTNIYCKIHKNYRQDLPTLINAPIDAIEIYFTDLSEIYGPQISSSEDMVNLSEDGNTIDFSTNVCDFPGNKITNHVTYNLDDPPVCVKTDIVNIALTMGIIATYPIFKYFSDSFFTNWHNGINAQLMEEFLVESKKFLEIHAEKFDFTFKNIFDKESKYREIISREVFLDTTQVDATLADLPEDLPVALPVALPVQVDDAKAWPQIKSKAWSQIKGGKRRHSRRNHSHRRHSRRIRRRRNRITHRRKKSTRNRRRK